LVEERVPVTARPLVVEARGKLLVPVVEFGQDLREVRCLSIAVFQR
jgi:hypothetical protein